MPVLRSGVRRSKRVNDVQNNTAELIPTAGRGAGRRKIPKAPVLKSPLQNPVEPAYLSPMSRPAGRGRGCRAINQDKNAKPFGAGVGGLGHTGLNLPAREVVAINDELVGEKSADKLAPIEEEGSASPLPERVLRNFHLIWL